MKAYIRTDCEYVILAWGETRNQARSVLTKFDGDEYIDITVKRVPELDNLFSTPGYVDEEDGETWCDECDPEFRNHELWHHKGHPGDHCFTRCLV